MNSFVKKSIYSVFIFSALAFFSLSHTALASSSDNLSGYAWSDNVGWVSFNCTNTNTCADMGGVDYGVNRNADGTLTGYAWSDAIGWIQFGGFGTGFPSGSGTQAQDANVNGNNLKGWARALSYSGNDWDGWISLSGAGYGVDMSGISFTGYAWGDNVIGWLSFDAGGANGVKQTGDANLVVYPSQTGGVPLNGQSAITYGTIPTFAWTLTSLPGGTTCTVSKTAGPVDFSATNLTVTGTSTAGTTSALTNGTYSYRLLCQNGATALVDKTVGFTVAVQPPGFTLGSGYIANIQFLNSGSADSEQKTISFNAVGGFANPVTISVAGPTPPAGTTYLYSLNSGPWSATPSVPVSSPYPAGVTFKAKVSKKITVPFTVVVTGTSGSYEASTTVEVVPAVSAPAFQEF